MINDKICVTRWWRGPDDRVGSDCATYVQVPEGDDRAIRIEGSEGWWFLMHSTHSPAFLTSHKVQPTGETILGTDLQGRPQRHQEFEVVPPPPGDPYWNAAEWELAEGYKPATAEEAVEQANGDRKNEEEYAAQLFEGRE